MPIKELDIVALTNPLPEKGLESGDQGTVVLVHGDCAGYEVEFMKGEKTVAVISVFPDQITLVEDQSSGVVTDAPTPVPVEMIDVDKIDLTVRSALLAVPAALENTLQLLISAGRLPIYGDDVTRAILKRLRAYYEAQDRIKTLLRKRYAGAGADFFVETVVFYLRALVRTHGLNFSVESERQVERTRNALRPDISLWDGDDLVAAIECKTQLGWNRTYWRDDFIRRERAIMALYPKAKIFLLVMTTRNWPGFDMEDKSGFALFNEWPLHVSDEAITQAINTPIEGLFRQLVSLQSEMVASA